MQQTGSGELAVVIGAGFGGLAAAVRLRALGYRVLVLEALERAGGRARTIEQDGFRFDAGPTLIAAAPLRELFARVGRDVRDYVVLSGYPCPLYDEELYPDWRRVTRKALADGARERTEVLWLSPRTWDALQAGRVQATLFEEATP